MQVSSLRKPLFGKEVEIVVWGIDDSLAKSVLEDAYERGRELEKTFNLYDKDSVLSRLNEKRRLKAPEELLIVMRKALEICQKTEGRYDISLGKQFLARKSGRAVQTSGCSYKDIKILDNEIRLTHPDVLVDLGSIAKGYIADEMADSLKGQGVLSGLIDARGDIRSFGEEKIIEVQHPREDKALCSIKLKDGGVATSGDYSQLTPRNPHILNSRWISVTVIAKTLMEADVYATAIFVSSKEDIEKLLSGTDIKAMCVKKDSGIECFNGFQGCLA
ncbi:MAG: FAD:protein FMN transferase [Candidatus Micrarchaeia archaeon]